MSTINREKIPYISFLFVAAVFFIAYHYFLAPIFYEKGVTSTAETIAEGTAQGDLGRQLALGSLALFSVIVLCRKGKYKIKPNGILGWLIVFFLSWASLSIVWADHTFLTFRKVLILWILLISALALSRVFSFRQITFLAFFCTASYLLIGIIVEVLLGTFHPFFLGYRFAGTIHPNHQGWNCATLLFVSLVLSKTIGHQRFVFICFALLALIFLLLTKSRTAFISAGFAVALYSGLVLSGRKTVLVMLAGVWLVCIGLLVFNNMGDGISTYSKLLVLLGRADPGDAETLTGRTLLWAELIPYIGLRPFLGYGYNAFWTPDRVISISKQLGWGVPGAHSGYLNLTLGVGIVGAIVYSTIMLLSLAKYIKQFLFSHNRYHLFLVMMLLFYLLVMLTEEIMSDQAIPSLVVYCAFAKVGFTDWRSESGD